MYRKLITNDVKRSKLTTAAIAVFIFLAALLASVAAALVVNLLSAIDSLMIDTKAPTFLLMHTGEVNMEDIKAFADGDGNVEAYQVAGFSNIDGNEITLNGNALDAYTVQDNGVSVQNEKFDFQIDIDGNIVYPSDGEIYVPVFYMREFNLEPGQQVTLYDMTFTIAGFIRDSFMGPSMISSKRFVVSPADYAKLEPLGVTEQLIEFRLYDESVTSAFNTAYLNAGLPANGPPPINKGIIQLANGMSDGIIIALLALMTALVVVITFLCVRFTLLAKVEDDYKEIGVLKAIGLRVSNIKKLYQAKYGIVAGAACLLGFVLAIPASRPFMENIRVLIGQSRAGIFGTVLGAVGAALIFLVIILYVNGVLRRFRKISASQAIRFGAPLEKSKAFRGFNLSGRKLLDTNVFIGIKDVLSRKTLYVTILLVLIIATFIMVVPRNIYDTISSRKFITNMGVGECDFAIGTLRTDNVLTKTQEIATAAANDPDVARHTVLSKFMFDYVLDDGSLEKIIIELGDHSVFPVQYSSGGVPQTGTDIALSTLNAEETGKTVGDTLTVIVDGEKRDMTVCGIFSTIMYGGNTAQAIFQTERTDALTSAVYVKLNAGSDPASVAARFEKDFPGSECDTLEELVQQTTGSMSNSLRTVSYAAIGTAAALAVLITLLFMKMLTAKDRYPIAVLKASGFTSRAIQTQYIARSVTVLVLGVVIGTVLANTLGEYVGMAMLSSFGASSFKFDINPLFAYVFSPAVLATCVYLATWLGISGIRSLKVSEHIKDN